MAREGNHSATLTVKGNARSANKEMQALANRQHSFERSIEKTNIALDRQTQKMQRANAAGRGASGGIGKLSGALISAGGYVAAAGAAVMVTEQFTSRMIDYTNVTADLKFNVDEITAAMDNMTTGFEASRGAALLQSTTLDLTQRQMNELAHLTATVADKNKRDLVTSWDAVTKAIAKGNVDRLRAIGLNTDNAKLLDEVARATGRSTTQIGLAERQQIAMAEVMRTMNEQAKQAGEGQDGLAFSFERMKNKSIDAFDSLGAKINAIPQDLDAFGDEVRKLTEDALLGMGVATEDLGETMEGIETAAEIAGRSLLALMTFGQSEFIPFLLEWETHLQTINGLMGDMPSVQLDRTGGLGVSAAFTAAARAQTPNALQDASRSLARGAHEAFGALQELAKVAEENAKKNRSRGRGADSKPAEVLSRDFEGPGAIDSAEQQRELDRIQDARVEAEIARERRRAEVVALRQGSNEALIAADEAARIRRAEIDEERAAREQDEVLALEAADQRDQVFHERKLRRQEESIRAAQEQHEATIELLEEDRRKREEHVQFIGSNATALAQQSASIAFSMGAAARAARAAGESEADARRRALGAGLVSMAQSFTAKAIAETGEGVVGSILGNPLAGRHFAAAAVYSGLAATVGGIGRKMVGSGGPAAGGGGARGGGGAAATPVRPANGPPSETPVPVSRPAGQQTPPEDPRRGDAARRGPRGGDFNLTIQASVLDPQVVEQITREQRDQARANGFRVGAG